MDVNVLSVISMLLGMVFGYAAFVRSKRKEDSEGGKLSGTLLTEIGYIRSGVDDIKRKQEKQDQQHIEVITRLTAVEASASQAHKRIDTYDKERRGN